jgi:hypothetical protein
MSNMQVWGGRIGRALSLRVILSSLFTGLLAGVVVGLVWPGAEIPTMWGVAAICYIGFVVADGQMTRCDACRKRVKLGASTCHHCGYARG